MRKQELMFAILKKLASQDVEIIGEGVVEVLQDGFGFYDLLMLIIFQDLMIFTFHLHKFNLFL